MRIYVPCVELPISSLMPIQADGVSETNLQVLRTLDELPPVETVLYGVMDGNPKSLLVDGTHRAYLAWQEGRETIPAYHATQDVHLRELSAAAVRGCAHIEDVHRRYDSRWWPMLMASGISSLGELPINRQVRIHQTLEW